MKYSSLGAVTLEKSGAAALDLIDRIVDEINMGNFGDGKIFVYDVEDAVRIRTGEREEEAL